MIFIIFVIQILWISLGYACDNTKKLRNPAIIPPLKQLCIAYCGAHNFDFPNSVIRERLPKELADSIGNWRNLKSEWVIKDHYLPCDNEKRAFFINDTILYTKAAQKYALYDIAEGKDLCEHETSSPIVAVACAIDNAESYALIHRQGHRKFLVDFYTRCKKQEFCCKKEKQVTLELPHKQDRLYDIRSFIFHRKAGVFAGIAYGNISDESLWNGQPVELQVKEDELYTLFLNNHHKDEKNYYEALENHATLVLKSDGNFLYGTQADCIFSWDMKNLALYTKICIPKSEIFDIAWHNNGLGAFYSFCEKATCVVEYYFLHMDHQLQKKYGKNFVEVAERNGNIDSAQGFFALYGLKVLSQWELEFVKEKTYSPNRVLFTYKNNVQEYAKVIDFPDSTGEAFVQKVVFTPTGDYCFVDQNSGGDGYENYFISYCLEKRLSLCS